MMTSSLTVYSCFVYNSDAKLEIEDTICPFVPRLTTLENALLMHVVKMITFSLCWQNSKLLTIPHDDKFQVLIGWRDQQEPKFCWYS